MYNIRRDLKRLEDQIQEYADSYDDLKIGLYIIGFILFLFILFFYINYKNLNNENMIEYIKYDVFTCINENESIDNIISMDYDYDNKVDPNNIYIHSVDGKIYNYEHDKCKKDNLYFKKPKAN